MLRFDHQRGLRISCTRWCRAFKNKTDMSVDPQGRGQRLFCWVNSGVIAWSTLGALLKYQTTAIKSVMQENCIFLVLHFCRILGLYAELGHVLKKSPAPSENNQLVTPEPPRCWNRMWGRWTDRTRANPILSGTSIPIQGNPDMTFFHTFLRVWISWFYSSSKCPSFRWVECQGAEPCKKWRAKGYGLGIKDTSVCTTHESDHFMADKGRLRTTCILGWHNWWFGSDTQLPLFCNNGSNFLILLWKMGKETISLHFCTV